MQSAASRDRQHYRQLRGDVLAAVLAWRRGAVFIQSDEIALPRRGGDKAYEEKYRKRNPAGGALSKCHDHGGHATIASLCYQIAGRKSPDHCSDGRAASSGDGSLCTD